MTNLAKRVAAAVMMTALAVGASTAAAQANESAGGPRIAADTSWSY